MPQLDGVQEYSIRAPPTPPPTRPNPSHDPPRKVKAKTAPYEGLSSQEVTEINDHSELYSVQENEFVPMYG